MKPTRSLRHRLIKIRLRKQHLTVSGHTAGMHWRGRGVQGEDRVLGQLLDGTFLWFGFWTHKQTEVLRHWGSHSALRHGVGNRLEKEARIERQREGRTRSSVLEGWQKVQMASTKPDKTKSTNASGSLALLRPGINIRPEWSDHKWTALSTGVNALRMHCDSIAQSEVVWATDGHILLAHSADIRYLLIPCSSPTLQGRLWLTVFQF